MMTLLHVAGSATAEPTSLTLLTSWSWRLEVLILLGGLGTMYVAGWTRLRRHASTDASVGRLVAHLAGLLALVAALLSPIDALADRLLTMHMVQHELLTMIAPPLLLLGNPLVVSLWALGRRPRRRLGALLAPGGWIRRVLGPVTSMPVALPIYATVLWGWHLPAAYQAALGSDVLHDLEHLSFFVAGLLFWWPIVNPAPYLRRPSYGFRLLYIAAAVGVTMVPAMVVGVFVRQVLYPHYAAAPSVWGLTARDDQALGWGVMGVVDGLAYVIAFLAVVMRMAMHEESVTSLEEAIERRPP